jgi:hypothetical protein
MYGIVLKILRKTLISTVCEFFMTFYLGSIDVNVPSKSKYDYIFLNKVNKKIV